VRGSNPPAAPPPAQAGADLASGVRGAAELEAQARETFEAINGTPVQNDAAGVLRAWAINGAMDRCMEAHGYPGWDWSQGRTVAPAADPLSASTFFARPLGMPVSETALEIRTQIAGEEALMAVHPDKAENAVIDICIEQTPPAPDARVSRASQPPQAQRLREAWWQLTYDIDAEFGDLERYHRCLDDAHLSVLEESGQPAGELGEVMASLVPASNDIPASVDADPSTFSAAWRHLVDTERDVSQVDWACRADVYTAHVDEVAAAIATFADDHAEQIDQTRRAWADVLERAEALGFDPHTRELTP